MKSKFSFTKLAFSNIKWGLFFSVVLMILWFVAFFDEKNIILPVVENAGFENRSIQSAYDYNLSDLRYSATLEINVNFLKKLFLTRPLLNLNFITCLFIIFLTFSIYRFVRNVEKGIDFKDKTYKLFYWISNSCFIYCIVQYISNIFSNKYILELTNSKYCLKWSFENMFIMAFIGYFFFILGHSFSRGFLLQKEQDLTV